MHSAGGAPQPVVEGMQPQADVHGGRGGYSMQQRWLEDQTRPSWPLLSRRRCSSRHLGKLFRALSVTALAAVTAIVVPLEEFGVLSEHITASHQGHMAFPDVMALPIIDHNFSPGEALVTARAARTKWGFSTAPSWGPWSLPLEGGSCQGKKAGSHCLAWRAKS